MTVESNKAVLQPPEYNTSLKNVGRYPYLADSCTGGTANPKTSLKLDESYFYSNNMESWPDQYCNDMKAQGQQRWVSSVRNGINFTSTQSYGDNLIEFNYTGVKTLQEVYIISDEMNNGCPVSSDTNEIL